MQVVVIKTIDDFFQHEEVREQLDRAFAMICTMGRRYTHTHSPRDIKLHYWENRQKITKPLKSEIVAFIEQFQRINKLPDMGIVFPEGYPLMKKISVIFNEATSAKKEQIIKKIANYCLRNKIKPIELIQRYDEIETIRIKYEVWETP